MGYGKKPLDFGEDVEFDKENGAKGKIPVLQREFQRIRSVGGLKASTLLFSRSIRPDRATK